MQKQPPVKARSIPISRNTPEKLRYFYHPDHIGSTSWVTDSAKNGIQYCEYLPYGEPFLEKRSTTWNSRYTFSGKERDGETGYSYFGARYYNSDISIWLSVDPLSDKYPNLSPYAYTANNPIKLVDPNGMEVVASDETSQTNIKLTLTKKEARFVRFDKNGNLDKDRLNKSKSTSENMTALKTLSNSDTKYIFSTASEFSNNGTTETLVGDNNIGTKGVTLIAGNEQDPSPDNNVHIIVSNKLSAESQVKTTAHEAYGHALFYEYKQQGQDVNFNHDYQTRFVGVTCDPNLNMDVPNYDMVDINKKLVNQIKTVTNQAEKNYQSRRKR